MSLYFVQKNKSMLLQTLYQDNKLENLFQNISLDRKDELRQAFSRISENSEGAVTNWANWFIEMLDRDSTSVTFDQVTQLYNLIKSNQTDELAVLLRDTSTVMIGGI